MKIRKRTIRRYLAMFLVLVLCMGMSLSTLASEIPKVENVNQTDGESELKEDVGGLTGQDDSDSSNDADVEDDEEDVDDDLADEPSGDDVTEDNSSDDLDDTETDDSLNDEEDLSDVDSTEDGGQTDDDTENEIEDVSEEKEPLINEVEIPEEVRQLRSLLDAMEAFELTQDNQEEYAALGMQASELLEMLLENHYGYPGMEDDMARFQVLADKQTGGADTLALIKGEKFTVNVVKVVNGNMVDSVELTEKCQQSTGHSGYNHSTNLRTLANESGFSGYKGYNWSKYTTVPDTYTSGLAPNNNYASVHYNITGSAPYKANETLFLFFEEQKEFVLKYDANGGSGAPGTQTATEAADEHTFIISDTEPWRDGYEFKGWSTSSTAISPSYYPYGKIAVTGTTTLYAVWERTQPKEASYTVEWYDTEGNIIKDSETRTGTIGKTVEVTDEDKKVSDYIFDEDNEGNIVTATLEETGTVLRLYFEKEEEKEASYTVEWYDTEGNTIKDSEIRTGTIGETVEVTDDDKVIPDYSFEGSNTNNVLSDTLSESGTILKLYFTKNNDPDVPDPDTPDPDVPDPDMPDPDVPDPGTPDPDVPDPDTPDPGEPDLNPVPDEPEPIPVPIEPEPVESEQPEPPTPPTPPARVIQVVPEIPEVVTPDDADTLVVIPDEDVARAVVYERVENPVTEEITYVPNEEIPVLEEVPVVVEIDSPDTVIILDEEVPQAFVKVKDPVTEDYVYIPEEEVPLASIGAPETGDVSGNYWMMLFMMSLGGMIFLLPEFWREKKNH